MYFLCLDRDLVLIFIIERQPIMKDGSVIPAIEMLSLTKWFALHQPAMCPKW